jgi:hypothetical protein
LRRDLSEEIFVWDTTAAPDGTYTVKVTASDNSSNAPDRALLGEIESSAFDIDNTLPAIVITGVPTEGHRNFMIEVREASRWSPHSSRAIHGRVSWIRSSSSSF